MGSTIDLHQYSHLMERSVNTLYTLLIAKGFVFADFRAALSQYMTPVHDPTDIAVAKILGICAQAALFQYCKSRGMELPAGGTVETPFKLPQFLRDCFLWAPSGQVTIVQLSEELAQSRKLLNDINSGTRLSRNAVAELTVYIICLQSVMFDFYARLGLKVPGSDGVAFLMDEEMPGSDGQEGVNQT
ncbi:hypothetical protein L211DRAFT_851576 [Terfezia boudieri ATCC MYA-4762]|uniref:Uncharacterized protein n=1 Tax=Terfezia boudieri ATCC MYA-4762 TaxID=1051890 RepID=A0A3N4LE99_9PEZI|nr:hypothetical protein L211DRAFT_851576 [Terfezia boudieri ATCC MYA-4762]